MNIMIIEDEIDILNGMKEAVQQLDVQFENIFTVTQAEVALELIHNHWPEIIVTDIVLPEMTGLDLMEQILDKDYHPKIIVISGYSNFTYAQRSIKLGAIDYMLKPFAREEFIQKIHSVVEMIHEEKEIIKVHQVTESDAMLGAKTLRDKFLLGLCTNPIPLHEHTVHRLKFFNLEWMAGGAFYVIALDRIENEKERLSEKETELQIFAVGNIVEDVLIDFQPSVMFRNIHNQWIIISDCDDLEQLAESISSNIMKFQYMKIKVGISLRTNSFQAVSRAYEQAIKAMRLAHIEGEGNRLYYKNLAANGIGSHQQNEYDQIVEYIYLDQPERIEMAVSVVINDFVVSIGINQRRELTQKCVEWVVHVHSLLADKLKITLKQITIHLWVDLDACDSIEELKGHLHRYFEQLSQQISMGPMNPIVEKAVRLIHNQYSHNITLQKVASELSTHPVWLSQLFKRETKQTFSDYLTEVRMEEAKRLLRESNLRIYEISEHVGYTDLQHFGQIFKKRTGLTPKGYRSSL